MRVTQLEGSALDFWVAKSAGHQVVRRPDGQGIGIPGKGVGETASYRPSADWTQGGGIVANEWYELESVLDQWFGPGWPYAKTFVDNPLKWLMRAYVATQFGDEVEEDVFDIGSAQRQADSAATSAPARFLAFFRGLGSSSGRNQLFQ